MTDDLISQKTMLDAAVRIRTAVAKKRPVAAHLLDASEIDLCQHERLVLRCFGDHDPEGIAHKRVTPELDPGALAAQPLETAAVHGGYPATVRNRVTALDGFPGVQLLLAVLRFLGGKPADRGRVQQNVRALQRRETGSLGIPLIPADQRAD